tara:strand:- start:28583 stop:28903 length:321 start_codon:yes stop_codon:yes gene_type:complete
MEERKEREEAFGGKEKKRKERKKEGKKKKGEVRGEVMWSLRNVYVAARGLARRQKGKPRSTSILVHFFVGTICLCTVKKHRETFCHVTEAKLKYQDKKFDQAKNCR